MDREKLSYRQGVVAAVRNRRGEFLVVQHPSYKENEWRFPGGGLGEGESFEGALRRELWEELAIEGFKILDESSIVVRFEWPDDLIEKRTNEGQPAYRGQEQRQFLVSYDGPLELTVDGDEIRAYKWIEEKELSDYLVFQNLVEMIPKLLADWRARGFLKK